MNGVLKLKPCPFCGGKAVIYVNDGVCVICTKCGVSTQNCVDVYVSGKPTGGAVGSVTAMWNRRADDEETG